VTRRFLKEVRERAPGLVTRRSFLLVAPPAFAIFYFVNAVRIHSPPVHLQVSARAFPMVIGAALLISAAVIVVQELGLGRRRGSKSEHDSERAFADAPLLRDDLEPEGDSEITSWLDFWVCFAALVLMVVLLDNIGFVLAATGLVAGLSFYFERRYAVKSIVIALGYAVALYYLFDSVFEIFLPNGLLPW
jgi:putative tricarboxylic transport membrane protein